MKNTKNTKVERSNMKPNDASASSGLPSPKRGAFPTPKAEIESAKPYIPSRDRKDGRHSEKLESPTNTNAEK
jgi:hypothetical protein